MRTISYGFQGQEAPVSIVSLTHSDFDDDSAAAAVAGGGAHGMPFVLNANRLNVALSRAQCLAIVVASPQLTQARAYMENKLARPSVRPSGSLKASLSARSSKLRPASAYQPLGPRRLAISGLFPTQARARTLERQRELNFHCRVVEAGSPDETGT